MGELDKLRDLSVKMGTRLHAIGIAINPKLAVPKIVNLAEINKHLYNIFGNRYIAPIGDNEVTTFGDGIHYDITTTQKIWRKLSHYIVRTRQLPMPTETPKN